LLNIIVSSVMKEDKNTENKILAAAEQEFLNKGFAATKTTEIASKAGVTHAMLNYYFRTKENLFNKVFEQKVHILAQSVRNCFHNPDIPFLERLSSGIEAHFDFLVQNPSLPRFVINEIVSNPQRLTVFKEKIISVLSAEFISIQKEIDSLSEKGEIRSIKAQDLIISIVSLNVFIFTVLPLASILTDQQNQNIEKMLSSRKAENVKTILARLNPKQ
jgi:Transcriptional regulator